MTNPSSIRQTLHQSLKQRFQIEKRLMNMTLPMVKASLVQYWIKCGKSNCSCKKGKGHGPYKYLSAKVKGHTRLKLVSKDMLLRIEEAIGRYHEYRNNFHLIRRLNKEVEILFRRLQDVLLSKSPYRFP